MRVFGPTGIDMISVDCCAQHRRTTGTGQASWRTAFWQVTGTHDIREMLRYKYSPYLPTNTAPLMGYSSIRK